MSYTEEEKKAISRLKDEGKTYKQIREIMQKKFDRNPIDKTIAKYRGYGYETAEETQEEKKEPKKSEEEKKEKSKSESKKVKELDDAEIQKVDTRETKTKEKKKKSKEPKENERIDIDKIEDIPEEVREKIKDDGYKYMDRNGDLYESKQ